MLSVFNAVTNKLIMLSVVMLSVVMLRVVMLSVIMLNVVASWDGPCNYQQILD
jgi:hypothetical protein